MGLFTPAWKSENYEDAKRAVEKITDNKKLEKIAFEANDEYICSVATRKITDQNILIKIAKTNKYSSTRETATKKIADQNVLIKIAETDKDSSIRRVAIETISDTNALSNIAKNSKYDYDLRILAICKISFWGSMRGTQDTLVSIARSGISDSECHYAIGLLLYENKCHCYIDEFITNNNIAMSVTEHSLNHINAFSYKYEYERVLDLLEKFPAQFRELAYKKVCERLSESLQTKLSQFGYESFGNTETRAQWREQYSEVVTRMNSTVQNLPWSKEVQETLNNLRYSKVPCKHDYKYVNGEIYQNEKGLFLKKITQKCSRCGDIYTYEEYD